MSIKNSYNESYSKHDHFKYNNLLYYAYIKTLVKLIDLKNGSSVLDVGCGQGFFSNLFRKCNMYVTGVDISDVGIQIAKKYECTSAKFISTDVMTLNPGEKFDCVFSRNLSLYNSKKIENNYYITDRLVSFLKRDGVFVFIYNTRLKSDIYCETWRYHKYIEIENHFSKYYGHKIHFVNKIAPWFFGIYSFNGINTKINKYLSEKFGFGVDIVCVLRNSVV